MTTSTSRRSRRRASGRHTAPATATRRSPSTRSRSRLTCCEAPRCSIARSTRASGTTRAPRRGASRAPCSGSSVSAASAARSRGAPSRSRWRYSRPIPFVSETDAARRAVYRARRAAARGRGSDASRAAHSRDPQPDRSGAARDDALGRLPDQLRPAPSSSIEMRSGTRYGPAASPAARSTCWCPSPRPPISRS